MTAALVRRALAGTVRQPAAWLPGLLFPLLVAAVFTADYQQAARALRFPGGESYLSYVLPATVLIGALYAGIAAGTAMVEDLTSGFLRRLLLSSVPRLLIVAGPLAAAAAQAVVQTALFVAIFAWCGAPVRGGVAGAAVLTGSAMMFAVAVGGLAITLGLRTGDTEVMQSLFGVLFIGMFVSSAFFPPRLMRGWFGTAARHSPLSWFADGMREAHAVPALAGAFALCLVMLPLAGQAMSSPAEGRS
jgi:ABC-2 type transport system permease protein